MSYAEVVKELEKRSEMLAERRELEQMRRDWEENIWRDMKWFLTFVAEVINWGIRKD